MVGGDFVTCPRRAHAIHKITKETFEPGILVFAFASYNRIQVLVSSDVDVLVRRQINNRKLRVVNAKAASRENENTNFKPEQEHEQWDTTMCCLVPYHVEDECPRKGKNSQRQTNQEKIKIFVVV
mgnify:CR=1 FL=1